MTEPRPARIGIFGGSFDPIHVGHLLMADVALNECGLERILFIPASAPPHKPQGSSASPEQRWEMVQMAVSDHSGFMASDMEMHRPGASFTLDTLTELRTHPEWKDARFSLLLGSDMLLDFIHWKQPDDILEQADLLIADRPGFDLRDAEERFLRRAAFVKTPRLDISSSEIRRRVREGKSIRYWVPVCVERFILKTGIYRL